MASSEHKETGGSGARIEPLDPFAGVPDPRYDVTVEGLMRRLLAKDGRPQPPVVRIEDAYITGALDLRAANLNHRIEFERCRFKSAPDLREATVLGLRFLGCWLPGLLARNLRTRGDAELVSSVVEGTVDLRDSVVEGSADLSLTRIQQTKGPALQGDRLTITGMLLAKGIETEGEVRLAGLHTGGNVLFSGADLHNSEGAALDFGGATIGGSLFCQSDPGAPAGTREAFQAVGTLAMVGARVAGDFVLRGAELAAGQRAKLEEALVADRVRIGGDVVLTERVQAAGGVRMVGAQIGGSLRLAGAEIRMRRQGQPSDPSLDLDRVEIAGDVEATGLQVEGPVRLADAVVHGSLYAPRAEIFEPGADAFSAPRTTVGGHLRLEHARIEGSLRLPGILVRGTVRLSGADISDPGRTGIAVDLQAARIGQDLDFAASPGDGAFVAKGEVDLHGAAVAQRTDFRGAKLSSSRTHDMALDARGLETSELALTPEEAPWGRVDLRRAHCGTFSDNLALWEATGGIRLGDFRYRALVGTLPVEHRLSLLRRAVGRYEPGAYDQLASVLRGSGHDRDAATVLLHKQRNRHAGLAAEYRELRPLVLLWSTIQRRLTGYGYRPLRAVGTIVLLAAAAMVVLVAVPSPEQRAWLLGAVGAFGCLFLATAGAAISQRVGDRLTTVTGRATAQVVARPRIDLLGTGPSDVGEPPSANPIAVDAFLETEDPYLVRTMITSLDDVAEVLGYERPAAEHLRRGPWWRRSVAMPKKWLNPDEAKIRATKVATALEWFTTHVEETQLDMKAVEAVTKLMSNLYHLPQGCLRAGPILLIKYQVDNAPATVLSRALSQREVEAFERFPDLVTRPKQTLDALASAVRTTDSGAEQPR